MPEEKSLLEAVVKSVGKLHNSASEVDKAQQIMRDMAQREAAVSPSSTNGEIEPED